MELLYRLLDSPVCNIIRLLLALCCYCSYTEAINHTQETFICTRNVLDQPTTSSYVHCAFKLNFTGKLFTNSVKTNANGVMDIIVDHQSPINYWNRTSEEEVQMSTPILRCVSNVAVCSMNNDLNGSPPMAAILKLTTTSNENLFYTKEKYTFRCEAHSFFYDDDRISWLLKYKNGTTLEPRNESFNDGHGSIDTVSIGKSELTLILLDTSLKEVICFASYFNKRNFSNVSIAMNILQSIVPIITTLNTDIGFPDNAAHQSLSCGASGRPVPKISWKRNNEEIQKPVRILDGNILFFPIYNFNFSGEYVCTATNIAGSDTKTFFLHEKKAGNNTLVIILVVVSFAIFLSILFVIYLKYERIKKYREMREIVSILNGRENTAEPLDDVDEDGNQTNFLLDTNYDIAKNTFIIDRSILLGKGEFGEMYRGLLGNEVVAFKTVSPNAGVQHLKALVSEAKILMYIGSHDHLVTLLGLYRQEINSGILYLAVEFCELGSLESFLRKHRTLFEDNKILNTTVNYFNQNELNDESAGNNRYPSAEDELIKSLCTVQKLLVWSSEIASVMEYLGTKKVIHSDVSTRNVMLTSEGTAKVTDFGLSRRTYNYSEYVKTAKDPLPWRWLAMESLRRNTFSVKSDVWGYGIFLWEVFSLGDIPYPGMSFTIEFVQELEDGLRNYKPKLASDEIYSIMMRCWHLDPEHRPTFFSMRKILNHAVSDGWTGLSDEISNGTPLEDIAVKLASSEYLEISTEL